MKKKIKTKQKKTQQKQAHYKRFKNKPWMH